MIAELRTGIVLLGLLFVAGPAAAQWTRIPVLPASDIFTVWASGDTIAAVADTAVYVSTDSGVTWKRSSKVAAGVASINSVWVRNGRLYAGTSGQGVFVSDDLGTTWLGFNQGLVGGFLDTQLSIQDLLVRGDSLYAATDGGAWVRNLATGTWSHFGTAFEVDQAPAMLAIAASDTRLEAAVGFNGQAFHRDRGDADWTQSWLDDVGPQPGLAPLAVIWTGHGRVMGTNIGAFVSPLGLAPWTPSGPDLGLLFGMSFALRDHVLFGSFSPGLRTSIEYSTDDGATWRELDGLPSTGVYEMAVARDVLYAAGTDGLWRRSIAAVSVPDLQAPPGLRFTIAGSQPIGDEVRFRFDLPEPEPVVIEVFDVAGRRLADAIRGSFAAGPNEIAWDARGLGRGIFLSRLTAGSSRAVVRLIHVR